jgi:hypothetical protein
LATDHPRRICPIGSNPLQEFRVRQEARLDLGYYGRGREDQTAVCLFGDEVATVRSQAQLAEADPQPAIEFNEEIFYGFILAALPPWGNGALLLESVW